MTTNTDTTHPEAGFHAEAAYRQVLDGDLTHLDVLRVLRVLDPTGTMNHASSNCRRAVERGRRYGTRVRDAIRYARTYTDEDLAERAKSTLPGLAREAVLLQALPTVEARRQAVREARRFYNATPDAGRWSDALASCVRELGGQV